MKLFNTDLMQSSLLHSLLGELRIVSGSCGVQGTISYASQEPWIFAGNIRQNILFGRPFNGSHYEEVTSVAALLDDFKQLPHGDLTIVGDRGVSVSGGQKARVNLARALYQSADIYLLDDPLSAVDSRVSRHLFDKCIKETLEGKLRILVTHQTQYLPQADYIVVMNEGPILSQGTYEELTRAGVDLVGLLASSEETQGQEKALEVLEDEEPDKDESLATAINDIPMNNLKKPSVIDNKPEQPKRHVESMAVGSISARVYWDYIRAAKSDFALIVLCILFLCTQGAISFAEYWLSLW